VCVFWCVCVLVCVSVCVHECVYVKIKFLTQIISHKVELPGSVDPLIACKVQIHVF